MGDNHSVYMTQLYPHSTHWLSPLIVKLSVWVWLEICLQEWAAFIYNQGPFVLTCMIPPLYLISVP